MDIVFYIIIFIIGTILGSLYAKIIQRIIKGKKLFVNHTYCGNCGKKIGFFEKIPILSYIFLKGKCKQCNKKINTNYIILEILMGFILLLTATGLNLNINSINVTSLISFICLNLYISYIIIVISLDKQNKKIPTSLLGYGIIISIIYIIFLCITEPTSIYRNVLYLVITVVLLLINAINTKRRAEDSYLISLLITILIMVIHTEKLVNILTMCATLISIAIYIIINKLKRIKKKSPKVKKDLTINILFIAGTLNLITFLILINLLG